MHATHETSRVILSFRTTFALSWILEKSFCAGMDLRTDILRMGILQVAHRLFPA